MKSVKNRMSQMSKRQIGRERKKLKPYKSISASESVKVLGDDTFFKDFIVGNWIKNAAEAESIIEKLIGRNITLHTTQCVNVAYRFECDGTIVARCGHLEERAPNQCVLSVAGGSGVNLFNFLLATSSEENAELYIKKTGRPVLLRDSDGSLKVFATGCNVDGEEGVVEGNQKKKNKLKKLIKAKTIKENEEIALSMLRAGLGSESSVNALNRGKKRKKRMQREAAEQLKAPKFSNAAAATGENDEDVDKTEVEPKGIEPMMTPAHHLDATASSEKSRMAVIEDAVKLIPEVGRVAVQKSKNIHKSEPAAGSDQNDEDVDKTRVMPKDMELTQACPRNEKKSRKAMLEQSMELIPGVGCGTIKNSKNGVEALAVDQKGSSDEE